MPVDLLRACCASCKAADAPRHSGARIAELGRAAKPLHLLSYRDSDYRGCTGVHANRHEGRHSVARIISAANYASPTAKAKKTTSPRSASASTSSSSGTRNTWTMPSTTFAPVGYQQPWERRKA